MKAKLLVCYKTGDLYNIVYQNKRKSLEWANTRRLCLPNQMTIQGSLNIPEQGDLSSG